MTQISQISLQNPLFSFRSIEEGNSSEELFFHLKEIWVFECSPDIKTKVKELEQKSETWRNFLPSLPASHTTAAQSLRQSSWTLHHCLSQHTPSPLHHYRLTLFASLSPTPPAVWTRPVTRHMVYGHFSLPCVAHQY